MSRPGDISNTQFFVFIILILIAGGLAVIAINRAFRLPDLPEHPIINNSIS